MLRTGEDWRYVLNVSEKYSLPPSDRRHHKCRSVVYSTSLLNFWKCLKMSLFCRMVLRTREDRNYKDTTRMRLTSIKSVQRQRRNWQAKEQVSLTDCVVYLEFIQGELKYFKRHACLLRACDTLEHVCMFHVWIIQWSNYSHNARLGQKFKILTWPLSVVIFGKTSRFCPFNHRSHSEQVKHQTPNPTWLMFKSD